MNRRHFWGSAELLLPLHPLLFLLGRRISVLYYPREPVLRPSCSRTRMRRYELGYDRNPVKLNWLNSAPALSAFAMSILLSLCLLAFAATKGQAASDQSSDRPSAALMLEVHPLLTSDGSEPGGTSLYADKYPKTIRVEHAAAFASRIAAYGAAYRVWIAPKGWTGSASVGADGSTSVNLRPIGDPAPSGPRLLYEDSGGCAGCALDAGAPYFPNARRRREELFGYETQTPVPRGLKTRRVSPKIVTYLYPSGHHLLARGVACFDPSQPFFEKAEFVLPRTDANLQSFLLDTFVGDKSRYSQHCESASQSSR